MTTLTFMDWVTLFAGSALTLWVAGWLFLHFLDQNISLSGALREIQKSLNSQALYPTFAGNYEQGRHETQLTNGKLHVTYLTNGAEQPTEKLTIQLDWFRQVTIDRDQFTITNIGTRYRNFPTTDLSREIKTGFGGIFNTITTIATQ